MRHIVKTCCLILGLVVSSFAGAGQITGCLTPGGKLITIALGESPAIPCGRTASQVQLAVVKQTICPCDFGAATEWAGWLVPICDGDGDVEGDYELLLLDVSSPVNNNVSHAPSMYLSNVDGCETSVEGGNTVFDRAEVLDAKELEACLLDLNNAALKLGLDVGCNLDAVR